MRKTLTILVASTALTAAIGLPAWSALPAAPAGESIRPAAAPLGTRALPLILASDDEDDDDRGDARNARRGHDDDDCDDEDDDECGGRAPDPAPAGAVAPPRNGLFGNGAPPRVQVN
jgi:hypothetical protein